MNYFFLIGTQVAYNDNSHHGNVTGGNYDNTARVLTITDNAGYNPRSLRIILNSKLVLGRFFGLNGAGDHFLIVYQG